MSLPRRAQVGTGLVGSGGGPKGPGIPLRGFVILIISSLASAAVWRRTGGDVLLSGAVIPLIYNTLERWISE
jgi:hypothetical protein